MKKLIFILLLIINSACKTNNEKIEESNLISEITDTISKDIIQKNILDNGENFVFYKAYYFHANEDDIPEISEDEVVSKFKNINVKLSKDTISIDNVNSYYTIEKKDSKKFFIPKYLYSYYSKAYKDGFNIDVKDNVVYINLDIENNDKIPFVDYFMEAGDAVFMNNCLFLNFGKYIICFKKEENVKNLNREYCDLPFDFEEKNKLENSDKKKYLEFYPQIMGDKLFQIKKIISENTEDNPDEIYQINNGNIGFDSFIYCTYGDSDSQSLINIKNNKIIANEALGYAMPENKTYQSFIINKDLTINIYDIDYNSRLKKILEKYQIRQDGSIVKIK